MKTVKTTRRTNLAPVITHGLSFRNSTGSLYGCPADAAYGLPGWLSGDERETWHNQRGDMDYVIVSYGTPIAWRTPSGWYTVEQRFSVTTSRHQSQVRQAIAGI